MTMKTLIVSHSGNVIKITWINCMDHLQVERIFSHGGVIKTLLD